MKSVPATEFADAFLRAKNLDWAADALDAFPGKIRTEPLPAAPPVQSVAALDEAPRATQAARPLAAEPAQHDLGLIAAMPERLSPFRVGPKPNRATRRKVDHLVRGLLTALAIALLTEGTMPRPALAFTVFDPLNYQQNLLSAVRALEQINNQVKQLQSEAQMILRMDQNLQRLGTTISPDLQHTLDKLKTQLQSGQGLALSVQQTEAGYAQMFPRQLSEALSDNDVLANAKSRWDEAYAGLQRSALLQAQTADGIATDTGLLGEAMARSQSATGALDVAQAGNELTALGVKQSLQLQGLLTAQARADTLQRARDLATEDEARQRFATFVGTGNGYAVGK